MEEFDISFSDNTVHIEKQPLCFYFSLPSFIYQGMKKIDFGFIWEMGLRIKINTEGFPAFHAV